ncbi:hypothetical protein HPB49_000689 [Dermacentor silvarum]|uniref:Uncharacterized protein n=1 Tax=Dermacentor silvarum TaxID=543639 RepID=A0ACB8CCT7_DERSI|nr:hypothetical protein HPB49_000689 [Dermacentor silvarum]
MHCLYCSQVAPATTSLGEGNFRNSVIMATEMSGASEMSRMECEDSSEDETQDGKSGSEGGQGGGGPPPSAGPQGAGTTKPGSNKPGPDVEVPKPGGRPLEPIKEVICTLGGIAATVKRFPVDGLCEYIFYTHVFVNSNSSELQSTTTASSYKVFLDRMLLYSNTEGGLSFDIQVADRKLVEKVNQTLQDLQRKNILHYGSLNVIDAVGNLRPMVLRALELLKELRKVQGDDKKRTVIAIGGLNYDSLDAFEKYENAIKLAGARNSGADTVIAISSTNAWFDEITACVAVPPATLTPTDTRFPGLVRNIDLISEKSQFLSDYTIGGLSMELAAILYTFGANITDPLHSIAYKPCTSATLAHLDMACESDSANRVSVMDFRAAFANQSKSMVLFYDDIVTISEKVTKVMEKLQRRRVAWLYFDVLFTDFLNRCGFNDPFEPIEILRDEFMRIL